MTESGWGGEQMPAAREFTEVEVLQAIGKELRAMKGWLIAMTLFSAVTAGFIAAWLLGLITIEFKPQSSGF